MPTRGVYAGSFDPPTNGHAWMIHHAATLFDELVVAIGVNPTKKPAYAIEQRLIWLGAIVHPLTNVRVEHFGNLFLVDFAQSINATHIVRGIRNHADFGYEQTMRHINSDMKPGIDTVFLMPPREISEVSSSLVRGVIGPAGWQNVIQQYVPETIYADLLKLHA